MVEFVERRNGRDERGLNLTREVRNGILCHSAEWPEQAATLEGQVVKLADKIAYVNHDVDDAVRAGIITESMIPEEARDLLVQTRRERLDTLVADVIRQSIKYSLRHENLGFILHLWEAPPPAGVTRPKTASGAAYIQHGRLIRVRRARGLRG